jgi:hypothetical protein
MTTTTATGNAEMTKRERAQVVELLRCAADVALTHGRPIATAKHCLNASGRCRASRPV